jgi:hypothetical protein
MSKTVALYDQGYADGYHGVEENYSHAGQNQYEMGYADGKGDRESGVQTVGVKSAFITEDYYENNMPPEGYSWTFELRTPDKGEVYLTKAGNAGVAKSEAKNGRQRHILKADAQCGFKETKFAVAPEIQPCRFAQGHSGKHSYQLLTP